MHPQTSNGTLADRLGNGLQNRVEQFDSARYLKIQNAAYWFTISCVFFLLLLYLSFQQHSSLVANNYGNDAKKKAQGGVEKGGGQVAVACQKDVLVDEGGKRGEATA